jgi:hypothetical protein
MEFKAKYGFGDVLKDNATGFEGTVETIIFHSGGKVAYRIKAVVDERKIWDAGDIREVMETLVTGPEQAEQPVSTPETEPNVTESTPTTIEDDDTDTD